MSIKELLIKKGIASMKISMRIVTLALLALCMALFTVGAFAQTQTTGSIEGTVVDTNGNLIDARRKIQDAILPCIIRRGTLWGN